MVSTWKWSELKKLLAGKSSKSFHDSIAIVWPVTYPADMNPPVDPHSTIMYLGDISDANFTKQEVLQAIRETDFGVYMMASVKELKWFGPDEDIPVLSIEHHYLRPYQNQLSLALGNRGIFSASNFGYEPHVTIADTSTWPKQLWLPPVELWWGKEKIML